MRTVHNEHNMPQQTIKLFLVHIGEQLPLTRQC